MGNSYSVTPVEKKWSVSIDIEQPEANINYVLKSSNHIAIKTVVGVSANPLSFTTNLLTGTMSMVELPCSKDGDIKVLIGHVEEMLLELQLLIDGGVHVKPADCKCEDSSGDDTVADD